MQGYMDEFYDQFITRVAECRKLEKTAVDAVGRGRILSGEAALKAGLVDELGGLTEALAYAQERGDLKGEEFDLEILRDSGGVLDLLNGGGEAKVDSLLRLGRVLGDAATAVGIAAELPSGPLAMLPFQLTLK